MTGAATPILHPTPGVTLQWLMDDGVEADAGLSLARMTVEPGFTSEAHRHPNSTEAVHVVAGRVEQRRGDDWVPLETGETVLIPADAAHQTRNVGDETAVLMLVYSTGAREYVVVE